MKPTLPRKIEMASYTCKDCGFESSNPIRKFGSSVLGLYNDHRFPGRCLLVYRKHVAHFEDLEFEDLVDYVGDIKLATNAIKRAMGVDRVNICILGTAHTHLHVHLIPRGGKDDLIPDKSPWNNLQRPLNLEETERERIVEAIGICVEKELGKDQENGKSK